MQSFTACVCQTSKAVLLVACIFQIWLVADLDLTSSSLTRPLLLNCQSHLVWRPGNANIWSAFVSSTSNMLLLYKEINPTNSFFSIFFRLPSSYSVTSDFLILWYTTASSARFLYLLSSRRFLFSSCCDFSICPWVRLLLANVCKIYATA